MLRLRALLLALRVLVGLELAAHGVARVYNTFIGGPGVPSFGQFLSARGFPLGPELAWLITVVEIVGGLFLALGFAVPWLALWFVFQLVMGIVLVHARFGWFVVGPHTGGMEYSVLLIVALLVVASDALERSRPRAIP